MRIKRLALVAIAWSCVVAAQVRADDSAPAHPSEELRGIVRVALLAPVYLAPITVPGGRDYVSAAPGLGGGVRLDAAGRVAGGFTLGGALGFAWNGLEVSPGAADPDRTPLLDLWAALLIGLRGTVANAWVVAVDAGLGFHHFVLHGDGAGLELDLRLGWKPARRFVIGIGVSLELMTGLSQSSPDGRVTPALFFERLL